MTDRSRSWLGRADVALDDARILLDHGRVSGCLNRAYYAAFYAARAALAGVGEDPKTHSGTHSRFAFHFVASGRLDRATGDRLIGAFNARQRADYDAIAVTDTRAAADALADAEAFVDAVRPLITAPHP